MASYKKIKDCIIKGEKGTTWGVSLYKKNWDELVASPVFSFSQSMQSWTGVNKVWVSNNGEGGVRLPGGAVANLTDSITELLDSTTYYVTIRLTKNTTGVRVRLKDGAFTNIFGTGIFKLQITSGTGSTYFYMDNIVSGNYSEVVVQQVSISPTAYNDYKLQLAGEGFEITWNGQGSTRNQNILGSELKLKMFVTDDDDESFIYSLLDGGFKDYFVRIYKGPNDLWWYGYIQPGFDTIENISYPYETTITATDSLGYYKEQSFTTFSSELRKQENYSIANVFKDFLFYNDLAQVNLVENSNFMDGSTRGWDILEGDTCPDQNEFTIAGTTTSGARKPRSLDGDTLVVGNKYRVEVSVTQYTSGTLYIKDGGGSGSHQIAALSAAGNNLGFNWIQTDNGDQNGLHFWTTDFIGAIGNVYCYLREDFPSDEPNYMVVNNEWETSEFIAGLAPTSQFYICKGAFADNENFPLEYKNFDVFSETLKVFNTICYLSEGKYNFIQRNNYFINPTTKALLFNNFNSTTSTADTASQFSRNDLLEIDYSNNYLLGGSTFTYESPLKSCTATFTSVGASFTLASGDDITDNPGLTGTEGLFTYCGSLTQNVTYDLDWFTRYKESQPETNLDLSTSGNNQKYVDFDYYITIKAVSSSNTYYLTLNSDEELEWSSSDNHLVLSRGFIRTPSTLSPQNSLYFKSFNEGSVVGALRTVGHYRPDPADITRYTKPTLSNGNKYEFENDLLFQCQLPELTETSSVFVKVLCLPRYRKYMGLRQDSVQVYPTSAALIDRNTFVEDVTVTARETTSLITNEFRVTEYAPSSSTAVEDFDLGGVKIGVSASTPEFSITYRDNTPITENIYRDGVTADQEPFTQFLAKQFLEPQISPLKILQGDIQSENISPQSVIKYSLNNDGDYEYFIFMGGTFKAQSEIMSGEWFRLKDD